MRIETRYGVFESGDEESTRVVLGRIWADYATSDNLLPRLLSVLLPAVQGRIAEVEGELVRHQALGREERAREARGRLDELELHLGLLRGIQSLAMAGSARLFAESLFADRPKRKTK